MPLRAPPTLARLLLDSAATRGEAESHTFLLDGERERRILTAAGLARAARAMAALLAERGAARGPVVLLLPPGLDFVVALHGCFLAGAVAVPLPPADAARPGPALERVRAAVADCAPKAVVAPARTLARDRAALAGAAGAATVWISPEEAEPGMEEVFTPPALEPEDLAFLQYTSGSTAAPRGVALSHANVLANLDQLCGCRPPGAAAATYWIPPFHDMGLLLGILLPTRAAVPVTLMDPRHFLERPIRWLAAMAARPGMVTAAPDFAYDLCVRRTTPEERRGLDLSGVVSAFMGAEPIRAATLDRFEAAFAPHGFRREAFAPGYGLAEATLCVTGPGPATGPGPRVRRFDADGLGRGLAREAPDGRALVANGRPLGGVELRIVDPAGRRPLPPGTVGEIWVAGPNVARGYHRPDPEDGFRAHLEPADGRAWLRTGDLGFLHQDELYVTGRLKQRIRIRGRTFHPADLEAVAEAAHPAVRAGGAAAFGVEGVAGEAVVVAVCRAPGSAAVPGAAILGAVRDRVAAALGEAPREVLLVRPADLPRTTSGKLRRGELRARWLDGTLPREAEATVGADAPPAGPGPAPTPDPQPVEALVGVLAGLWSAALGRPGLGPDAGFFEHGGDSLKAADLGLRIREEFGIEVAIHELLDRPTPRLFVEALLAAEARRGRLAAEAPSVPAPPPLALAAWVADPLGIASRTAAAAPDMARLDLAGFPLWLVFHPDGVRQVLQTNARNYTREGRLWQQVRHLVGTGMLTEEGPGWGRARRALGPPLAGPLVGATPAIAAAVAAEALAGAGSLDATAGFHEIFLRIACRLFFDVDPGPAIPELVAAMGARLAVSLAEGSPDERTAEASPARPRDAVDRLVDEVLAAAARGEGALGPGLASLEDPASRRAQIVTMLFTGTSSPASMTSWALVELGHHPGAARQVADEVRGLAGPVDPARAPYLAAVLQESMRLHPPVWAVFRSAQAEDHVLERRIEPNATVVAVVREAQRHPAFWDDPTRFDPGRFLPGGRLPDHPGAYLPFGMGSRTCVGRPLAASLAAPVIGEIFRRGWPTVPAEVGYDTLASFTVMPRKGTAIGFAAPPGSGFSGPAPG